MSIDKSYLLKEYTNRLRANKGALFVGAGISVGSGYVTWKELLREPANAIGLNVEKEESDLPQLAQYFINKSAGNKNLIIDSITNHFYKNVKVNNVHKIIARLPIQNIWTTNYDCLIEEAHRQEGKKYELFIGNKGWTKPSFSDVKLYKMHGSISEKGHEDLIFTRRDYESYPYNYTRMWEELRSQLATFSFLFLGFSFSDPNVSFALALARNLLKEGTSPHYIILKKQPFKKNTYEARKFNLWVDDLAERNIYSILIDDYQEIEDILLKIEQNLLRQRIFISGSHENLSLYDFCTKLGAALAERKFCLVTASGKNIGEPVVAGAMAAHVRNGTNYQEYIELSPWAKLEENFEKHLIKKNITNIRKKNIKSCCACIFISGGKGTKEEYEISKKYRKIIIPIGFTDGTARLISDELISLSQSGKLMYQTNMRIIKKLLNLKKEEYDSAANEIADFLAQCVF